MQTVGVLAVVQELQKFLGDMRQVNSAIDRLRPSGSILQDVFASLGESVANFGQKVWDVVSVTLGVMLRDAIEGIIGSISRLVQEVMSAAAEFQTLKIRLTGLNLNETVDGVNSYSDAMAQAVKLTAEQLTWLQALGAATPFDPTQIADTYAQARAFGFVDEEARRLTQDIIDYTAGMGLSNDTMFLVIQNLGQMVQRGKITGTEIRDLARGSFLPLADVLGRVAKNMGMTVAELTKEISTPAGIPAKEFVKAFEAMVEEEPRFVGAAGRLSRALVPASMNVKELFTSIFGLSTLTPVFDILGSKVASFTDQFVSFNEQGDIVRTLKWEQLVAAAQNLGTAIGEVVQGILGLLPSAEGLASGLINGVQGLAVWIHENQSGIIGFFKGIGETIQNNVVPFIRDRLIPAIGDFFSWIYTNREGIFGFFAGIGDVIRNTLVPFVRDQLIPAFNQISEWVDTHKETINKFFGSLGEIVTDVFAKLTGQPQGGGESDFVGNLLDTLGGFMEWVTTNKDKIAEWLATFLQIFLTIQMLIFAFNGFIGILAAVWNAILPIVTIGGFLIVIFGFLAGLISAPFLAVAAGILLIGAAIVIAVTHWEEIKTWYAQTSVDLDTWRADEKAKADTWWAGFGLVISGMATQTSNDISSWCSNTAASLDTWRADQKAKGDQWWADFGNTVSTWTSNTWNTITTWVQNVWNTIVNKFNEIVGDIQAIDWPGVGRSVIDGIVAGVSSVAQNLATTVANAAVNAYNAAMGAIGAHSPSTLFMNVGENAMLGMAKGIELYAGVATSAMTRAMATVATPAVLMQSMIGQSAGQTVNNTDARNFNLTVNSSSPVEPITQDFNMLQSLSGA